MARNGIEILIVRKYKSSKNRILLINSFFIFSPVFWGLIQEAVVSILMANTLGELFNSCNILIYTGGMVNVFQEGKQISQILFPETCKENYFAWYIYTKTKL